MQFIFKKGEANINQCVDITFANPEDVAEVNASNCFNSSTISFNNVYSIALTASAATRTISSVSMVSLTVGLFWAFLL